MFMPRRKAVQQATRAKADIHTFPAPIRGWVTNESLASAKPGGARVLENFFPTKTGIRVRGGMTKWATVHATDPVQAMMTYQSALSSALFAATTAAIYDVSNPASTTVIPSAAVTGQTSGDYSFVNMTTEGGEFLIAVNGADRMLYFDGTTWRRVDEATHELAYDAQTGNFAAGLTVTGGTSGATGVIVTDTDGGTTGTLRIKTVTGTFADNETITDSATGSATSNIPSGAVAVPAITGVSTDVFSYVWVYKERLFFVEKDTQNVWYLPVASIGGAAQKLPLQGVFGNGGTLVMGGAWSANAGDGLDSFWFAVTDQGEVAVYQGNNPNTVADWQTVGVYFIGTPLSKNAHIKAGGDTLIAVKDGLVPISACISKDPAALALAATSYPIEPTWRATAVRQPGRWVVAKWVEKTMAIVGFPANASGVSHAYVVNLQTGAWAQYSGWDIHSAATINGQLYCGTSTGFIYRAEQGAKDNGITYYCTYIGLHERLGNPMQEKSSRMCRATFQYGTSFNYRVGMSVNYGDDIGDYPIVAPSTTPDSTWDGGLWDVALWDGGGIGYNQVQTQWKATAGRGYVVAPVIQITMGSSESPRVEYVSCDYVYERGAIVT